MRLLVAGSGAVGASTALAALEAGIDTELIERRDDVCAGASKRAFGGIRQQFDDDAEIALAKASLAFFRTLPTSLFDPVGYLYLATNEACEATLRERYARQVRLGVACTWL
jgi:glycine/D-amino acid oxidase-like deaminating enzyme